MKTLIKLYWLYTIYSLYFSRNCKERKKLIFWGRFYLKKILIFIATLFVFVGSVKAENVTLVKDVYDNTYVYYYDRSMGKTRYLHASK